MTYRAKFWLSAALALGAAAMAGLIIESTVPTIGGSAKPVIVLPVLLVVGGLVLAATWPSWQKTDDVQKQGHLMSWYWGGTTGALAMMITLVVMSGRHSDMSMGAIYLLVAQFLGAALFFIVWRLRGRGQKE